MKNKKACMKDLRERIENCDDCGLCEDVENRVPGKGSMNTGVIFVGEAPGAQEDRQGEPFVGQAGRLLDQLFEEVDLSREEVYITNIVKCRPPGNRKPYKKEIKECSKHLTKELDIIKPKIVAPLGNTALSYFMELFSMEDKIIGEVHGQCIGVTADWGSTLLVPQYHPAAAIYNRDLRPELVEDMGVISSLIKS